MRLIFDTNILISALLFEDSKPSKAFNIGIKQGSILFSTATLAELENVLWRKKFNRYITNVERITFLSSFVHQATPVKIHETITECRDLKDNKFLELGVCGEADFIISGDEDLLILNPFRNIQIVSPDQFIKNYSE